MGKEFLSRGFRVLIKGTQLTLIEKEHTIIYQSRIDFYNKQDGVFIQIVLTRKQDLVLASYEAGVGTLAVNRSDQKSGMINLAI